MLDRPGPLACPKTITCQPTNRLDRPLRIYSFCSCHASPPHSLASLLPRTATGSRYRVLAQSSQPPFLPPQQRMRIPQQHPLIPPHRRHPPPRPKQTPVHPRRKLRMPIHQPQLRPRANRPRPAHPRPPGQHRRHRRPVRPHPHRHVVARAHQNVPRVRTPRQPPHRVLVARQHRQRPARGVAHVESADRAVDAARRDHRVGVLVPVVREDLGGDGAGVGCGAEAGGVRGRRVDGDGRGEVVFCGGRGAQVEEADVRVGGGRGEEGGVGRGEGDGVGAAADGEGEEGGGAGWGPLWGGGRWLVGS